MKAKAVKSAVQLYWQPAIILFRPHSGGFISWPPAKYLGDGTIKTFIERFNAPVNVPIL